MYTATLWPDPITIATTNATFDLKLNYELLLQMMEIVAYQNCKMRNVFSYYGIIDDLVLCFPNYNDIIKEFTA